MRTWILSVLLSAAVWGPACPVLAADKPNIVLIVSDDFGYGDAGSTAAAGPWYAHAEPRPLAAEGMTFFSFYGQPSCTPGRAAMQTGRFPNRSGMTTVAFQGQGGGLPAAEWTLASVLKTAGYKTYFTGKWHLGESDYALPNAQGYDVMKYAFLYHFNAYTYADPKWFPDMPTHCARCFQGDQGRAVRQRGRDGAQDWKVNGEYVDTPDKGVVGIPYLDKYVEKAAMEFLDDAAKTPDKPFFININFMKVHQPNLPHPDFIDKSLSKSKYADSLVEADTRIGHVVDKLRALGLDKEHPGLLDHRQWGLAGRLSRCWLYAVPGHQGHRPRRRQSRPGHRLDAGQDQSRGQKSRIVGGLDLMATFAALAGVKLPEKDREGQPMIFDSYDMSPLLFGTGKSARKPGSTSPRTSCYPERPAPQLQVSVQSARRRRRAHRRLGGGQQPGMEGCREIYRHRSPNLRPLADPQERYDIFMNNFTERTWMMVPIMGQTRMMKTFVQYPPRKLQSEATRADHDLGLREVPVNAGAASE